MCILQDKIKKAPHIEETTRDATRVYKLEPEQFILSFELISGNRIKEFNNEQKKLS